MRCDQVRHALGIDPELLRAAAHLHARSLEVETRVHANRQAWRYAQFLADGDGALDLALGFAVECYAQGYRAFQLTITLAWSCETDPSGIDPRG